MLRVWLKVLLFSVFAVATLAVARTQKPWETDSAEEWTLEEAEEVLRQSPWVNLERLFIRPGGRLLPVRFAIRIRSAEPVRMALALRMAALPSPHVRSAASPDPEGLRRTADSLKVPGMLLISVQCEGFDALDALNRQSLRTFRNHAYLDLSGSGERLHLVGYEAPWQSKLKTAVFQFSRPAPEEAGERMTFVARFGAPNIVTLRADFHVDELRWKGQIEY